MARLFSRPLTLRISQISSMSSVGRLMRLRGEAASSGALTFWKTNPSQIVRSLEKVLSQIVLTLLGLHLLRLSLLHSPGHLLDHLDASDEGLVTTPFKSRLTS
jgi:hypothetical protein